MDKGQIWHRQQVGKLEKLKLLSTFTTPLNKLDLTRISKLKHLVHFYQMQEAVIKIFFIKLLF